MNLWTLRHRLRAALPIVALLAFASGTATALTGHIFTTDASCGGTNVNLFTLKDDIYMDGGPRHSGSAALVDGSYYVQVTDPSGKTVLGTSVGSATPTPAHVTGGSFDVCYHLSEL